MNINSAEENKNKFIATTISIVIFSLLVVFLALYSFITPEKSTDSGSIEVAEFGGSEHISGVVELENSSKTNQQINSTQNSATASSEKVEPINQKTDAELLSEQFIANKGKNTTISTGVSENTSPINSTGITGNSEIETSNPPVNNHIGISLTGRKIITNPSISKDTKEQGKVVVEILVDNNGNVIKADPNGRGTTTGSSVLKEKAKQAALSAKFNSSLIEEQKGTITIVFSF